MREAALNVDGTSALTGVVAFAFFGLLGVAYVFVATSAARPQVTAESAGTGAADDGAVAKALELGLRLRRAHGHDRAEVRHAP
ncbi:MAG: hypothetical protein KC486_16530 [Myxococcales bacterium]|nr:hypothetical protein [Myxococcales bacterium]